MISVPRPFWLAKPVFWLGSSIARSSLNDLIKGGVIDEYSGIKIIASDPREIESVKSALFLLKRSSAYAERLVVRWINSIAFTDNTIRWNHFCDGIVFLWSRDNLPVNVLASYLYRYAIEICLFKRFNKIGVIISNARCKLMVYRRELELMKRLKCDNIYISQQEEWIGQLLKKRLK